VSGTGTSAMETAVANLVGDGTRVLSIVGGYFADRLAGMSERYGGSVTRLAYEWGRAVDPDAVRRALRETPADIVTVVHAETSTGVLNPVEQVAAVAREHGALTIVDAVTSLGGHPVEVERWGIGAAYSCAQKCVGAPSGVAPITFAPEALERRVKARSFYFDLALLEDYWVRRKYHHTICASLLYALREALLMAEEEGLEARWARHRRHHLALAAGVSAMGLSLLPPEGERLWTLNAVRVPDGVDEAAVRKQMLQQFDIEVGAGLGPLAGKIWRVGLMGASSTPAIILLFLGAFESVLRSQGAPVPRGAGTAAALDVLG
jgi:alanine-glyoxylate transaminase/serine-glyoxylate transaminase/serine-pyruvate transaminase